MRKSRKKKQELILHSMTRGGAASLFNFYSKHFGSELIEGTTQVSEGKWRIVITHPFPEE
jgi:hypothetical protein